MEHLVHNIHLYEYCTVPNIEQRTVFSVSSFSRGTNIKIDAIKISLEKKGTGNYKRLIALCSKFNPTFNRLRSMQPSLL